MRDKVGRSRGKGLRRRMGSWDAGGREEVEVVHLLDTMHQRARMI